MTGSISNSIASQPRFAAIVRASSWVSELEWGEGMITQVTVLGAEGVGGDQRDEGRVDAAREAEDGMLEAVLAGVVAESGDERGIDLVGDRSAAADPRRREPRAGVAGSETATRRAGSGRRAVGGPATGELEVAEQQLLLELRGPGDRRRRRRRRRRCGRRRRARPGRRPCCRARPGRRSRGRARRPSPRARSPWRGGRGRPRR